MILHIKVRRRTANQWSLSGCPSFFSVTRKGSPFGKRGIKGDFF